MNTFETGTLNFYRTNKKGLCFSIVLSLLYVLPLILANVYYMDDLGRIMDGYSWTNADGRFASSLLMRSLSLSPYIVVNLYPYYTMISAAIIAVSGYILCCLFGIEKDKTVKLSSLFLLVNPFFLSNLAFKYDCLPMALSIFVLIIPFFFINKSHIFFTVVVFLCSYLCFCLYQPTATGVFVIGSFYMLQYCKRNELQKVIYLFIKLLIATVFAYVLWRATLSVMNIGLWGRGALSFLDPDFYFILSKQWNSFIALMKSLSISYAIAISVFLVLSVYAFIRFITKLDAKRGFLAILILLFAIISTFAINFVTTANAITPRTQTVYGLIFFILVYFLYDLRGNMAKLRSFGILLVLFFSFLLSSLFGQALKNQDDYNNFIISQVSSYLAANDHPQLHIVGSIGVAPRNEMVMEFYPILKELTPIYSNEGFFALCDFSKFGLVSEDFGKTFTDREMVLDELNKYPILNENKYYILRAKEDVFILDFNKSKE